jgi:hypothetical protein
MHCYSETIHNFNQTFQVTFGLLIGPSIVKPTNTKIRMPAKRAHLYISLIPPLVVNQNLFFIQTPQSTTY